MNFFLDTEFTNFSSADLISIGVTDGDHSFYMESSEYSKSNCSQFVKDTVLPLLQHGEVTASNSMIGSKLKDWLLSFNEPIYIYVDSDYDIEIFKRLYPDDLSWIKQFVNVYNVLRIFDRRNVVEFKDYIDEFLRYNNLSVHHALNDALAMHYAHFKYRMFNNV